MDGLKELLEHSESGAPDWDTQVIESFVDIMALVNTKIIYIMYR